MKLSTRCRYGTRAMIELGKNYNKGPIKRREIEELEGISKGYLENILSSLREHNFVSTIRGAEGGFVLNKHPSEISLYDIVTSLEGSISPVDCLEKPDFCSRFAKCSARIAWKRLYDAQVNVLSSVSLQDLIDIEHQDECLNFSI